MRVRIERIERRDARPYALRAHRVLVRPVHDARHVSRQVDVHRILRELFVHLAELRRHVAPLARDVGEHGVRTVIPGRCRKQIRRPGERLRRPVEVPLPAQRETEFELHLVAVGVLRRQRFHLVE